MNFTIPLTIIVIIIFITIIYLFCKSTNSSLYNHILREYIISMMVLVVFITVLLIICIVFGNKLISNPETYANFILFLVVLFILFFIHNTTIAWNSIRLIPKYGECEK